LNAYLDGLKTVLDRSFPLPISIALLHTRERGHRSIPAIAATAATVLSVVVPTAQRWKHLELDVPSSRCLKTCVLATLDALESVDIEYTVEGDLRLRPFFPSPRLHGLTFMARGQLRAPCVSLPWWQLSNLEIMDVPITTCRAIFQQCTNLASATIHVPQWHFPNMLAISLPFLHTLDLNFHPLEGESLYIGPFFTSFFLPALKILQLTFNISPMEQPFWPSREFSTFQNRSPHIQDLTLTCAHLTGAHLISVLRHNPALTNLDLSYTDTCVDDVLLQELRYDPANPAPPLAPKLENLMWTGVGYLFGEEALEAAIRSRWWTWTAEHLTSPPRIAWLKSVVVPRLEDEKLLNDELISRMQDVAEQGLVSDLL
jgi:hypothetical protein